MQQYFAKSRVKAIIEPTSLTIFDHISPGNVSRPTVKLRLKTRQTTLIPHKITLVPLVKNASVKTTPKQSFEATNFTPRSLV
jgi:hypothetical protein